MHLRRREPEAGGVLHGLGHVGDQAADVRRRGIGNRRRLTYQDRVAQAGDLQDGHADPRAIGPNVMRPAPCGRPSFAG